MDATLLNVQKQEVFDILRDSGLDPHNFEWGFQAIGGIPGRAGRDVSRLLPTLRPEFSFLFDFYDTTYHPHCSPWEGMRQASLGAVSWPSCLSFAQTWARLVNAELRTPDPWEALPGLATSAEIAVAANVANTEFSHRETERLASGLDEIRRLLLGAVGDSREQAALIDGQMQSLLEASKRMGRKDWANLAIGAVVTLALQLALPPETVRQAFEILKQTLTGVVHLIPQFIATGHQLT
jgi:hypothetical protein